MMAQSAWQQTPLPNHSEGTWDGGSPTGAETLTPLPLLTQQAQQPQKHTHLGAADGASSYCYFAAGLNGKLNGQGQLGDYCG